MERCSRGLGDEQGIHPQKGEEDTYEQSDRKISSPASGRVMAGRPKVGGFPYLAENSRRAGVTRNSWCSRSQQGRKSSLGTGWRDQLGAGKGTKPICSSQQWEEQS